MNFYVLILEFLFIKTTFTSTDRVVFVPSIAISSSASYDKYAEYRNTRKQFNQLSVLT